MESVTPGEILPDLLIFEIRDVNVRKRLLREFSLTPQKTDEICHASESTAAQMKEVGQGDSKNSQRPRGNQTNDTKKPCGKCGRSTSLTTVKLAVGHAGTVEIPTISHPFVVVESVEKMSTPEELYIISDVAAVTANDRELSQVKPIKSAISAYCGAQLPVVGQVILQCCASYRCHLDKVFY